MVSKTPGSDNFNDELQRVHWHIMRYDSRKVSVASRAATLLSTNALVIAGIALAFGLKNHKPGPAVTVVGVAALCCVAGSVAYAILATMTNRKWNQHFPQHREHARSAYSFIEIDNSASSFDDFKQRMANQSAEQILEDALVELWQGGVVYRYRYRTLRVALLWLIAALCLLLTTVAASTIFT